MSSIEMKDLSSSTRDKQSAYNAHNTPARQLNSLEATENAITSWSWVSAALLITIASCFTLFPRLLLFISESSSTVDRRAELSPLESFLALHFGIWLAALSGTLIIHTPSSDEPVESRNAVTTHPLLIPISLASTLSSFLAYNTKDVGPLAFITFVGAGIVSLWGLWVIVFGGSSLVSRKTGADKHTSSFLFGNKSAASSQKKEWKKSRTEE